MMRDLAIFLWGIGFGVCLTILFCMLLSVIDEEEDYVSGSKQK